MRKRVVLTFRIFLLLLILPLLGIAFAPPLKINAACSTATGSQIQVSGGLITALDVRNFNASMSADVSCVAGQPASIPQFSIQDYDSMKRDYFDQAKSTYNKITVPGPATQNSVNSPINLISF